MAISKIQAESMNLADTYDFTGTVTGTPNDMVQVASATGGGTATQVFNGCFTSTYKFYLVLASYNLSATGTVSFRFQDSSNNEITTSNYYNAGLNGRMEIGGSGVSSIGNWGGTSIHHGKVSLNVAEPSVKMFVYNPFASEKTVCDTVFHAQDNASGFNTVFMGTTLDSATSVTGIRFLNYSGNFNSRSEFRIYGIK
jgi:hypothetical protein